LHASTPRGQGRQVSDPRQLHCWERVQHLNFTNSPSPRIRHTHSFPAFSVLWKPVSYS
jgi:hypothetical protein